MPALDWSKIGEGILTQVGALLAFFAFPAFQFLLLRFVSKNDGRPELWYLPRFGFRLVISNIPRKRSLSDIRYRVLLRKVVPAGDGSSVRTFLDTMLLEREDFFLFPGCDQVLVCFKLRIEQDGLRFLQTDKLGVVIAEHPVEGDDTLIADYTATIENFFNFDVSLARRVETTGQRLREIAQEVAGGAKEREFALSRVRKVG